MGCASLPPSRADELSANEEEDAREDPEDARERDGEDQVPASPWGREGPDDDADPDDAEHDADGDEGDADDVLGEELDQIEPAAPIGGGLVRGGAVLERGQRLVVGHGSIL